MESDAGMLEALGTLLWDGPPREPGAGLAARVVGLLDGALPGTLRELRGASYAGLVDAAVALEEQLFAAGALRSSPRRLGAVRRDIEGRFALKRRRMHLVYARALISAELHNSSRIVDSEQRGLGGGKATKGDGGGGGRARATSFGGADDDSGFFRLPACQVRTGAER